MNGHSGARETRTRNPLLIISRFRIAAFRAASGMTLRGRSGGSLRRELTDRTQPILDVVGADHLAAFKRMNVDRHQLE
jgi:hypothetical protein